MAHELAVFSKRKFVPEAVWRVYPNPASPNTPNRLFTEYCTPIEAIAECEDVVLVLDAVSDRLVVDEREYA
jgi:hypothetical protein